MYLRAITSAVFAAGLCVGLASPALAQTPDGEPPAVENVCDAFSGAAFAVAFAGNRCPCTEMTPANINLDCRPIGAGDCGCFDGGDETTIDNVGHVLPGTALGYSAGFIAGPLERACLVQRDGVLVEFVQPISNAESAACQFILRRSPACNRSCELNTAGTEFVCPNGELCCADVLAGHVPPGDEQFCKFCARTEQACLAQAGFRCNVPE